MRDRQFSLTTRSLSSATWYASVVGGWTLLAVAVYSVATAQRIEWVGPLAMIGLLLVVLELLPLVQGRGHDPQGVVMSTAFTCAMLFVWGIWPAVIMIAIASMASDLRARKNWWKTLFNPAQYSLSVGAAYVPVMLGGHHPTLAHPLAEFTPEDLGWAAAAWVVYFVVNLALVVGVLSFTGNFVRLLTEDLGHSTAITFAVLGMSPLIVVVTQNGWTLLPLLLVPLVLVYYTAQMSLVREHEANHDPLTGLPNRASLQFELRSALDRFRDDDEPFGLILIDLDNFKSVNDTLGHASGDELLCQFAQRLRRSLRDSDHVARLGGDEFAVVVLDAAEADVCIVAERIQDSIADSLEVSGITLEVEMSMGIAMCPTHGEDADTLLRRADVAMYWAKADRTVIEIYSAERDDNSADRLGLLGELRQALEDHALELHYQPKVAMQDGALLGMEALIRWNHPVRGFISPDEFIPLAERSGIMPLLTEHIVALALSQIARWRDAGLDVPVAVNIAPTDLVGDHLARVVEEQLREHGLAPNVLRLEITERTVTRWVADAKDSLTSLRTMGVTVSLDDFGTGYSSMLRLSTLPVDEIKIDRTFVSKLHEGPRAVGIVRAFIDLAHALGVPAIAEGVETAEEWDVVHALGCDGVQGWHVARPMPIDRATDWVRDRVTATEAADAPARTRRPAPHLGVRHASRALPASPDLDGVTP